MKTTNPLVTVSWLYLGRASRIYSHFRILGASAAAARTRGGIRALQYLAVVALALAFTACPQTQNTAQQPDPQTEALKAEVARLKAQSDAQAQAASAQSLAQSQAQANADVAAAEAAAAKAEAEADEAAKVAGTAQEEFKSAQAESDEAKEEADKAKGQAEESQKIASEPSATLSDAINAQADADRLAAEVAKAEAARLRAELARTKAKVAAIKVRSPITDKITDFFRALATALFNPAAGGRVFALNSTYGSINVPPNLPPGAGPWLMNQFGIPTYRNWALWGASNGRQVITAAQFGPPGTTFPAPGAEVFIDLPSPSSPGFIFEVMESVHGVLVSYQPQPVWATVTTNPSVARAMLPHFCVVALVTPKAGDPSVPKNPEIVTPPPTEREVIAKANAEASAAAARDKAYAANLVQTSKQRLAKIDDQEKASEVLAKKKAEDAANLKAKQLAEQRIKDLKKQKAKALADKKAIERETRREQAQARQRAQQQAQRDRALQQQRAQQEQQMRQQQQLQQQRWQQQQQQQQQPPEDNPDNQ